MRRWCQWKGRWRRSSRNQCNELERRYRHAESVSVRWIASVGRGEPARGREREREKREKRGRPSNARAFLKDLRQASQLCLALGLGARHFCFCFIEANACRGERMESFQGMVESAHTAWEIMVESAGEGSACVCARASEKQDRSDRGRFCRRYRRCGDVARCLLQPERRKKISQERGED
jgi:hypothetical protein